MTARQAESSEDVLRACFQGKGCPKGGQYGIHTSNHVAEWVRSMEQRYAAAVERERQCELAL